MRKVRQSGQRIRSEVSGQCDAGLFTTPEVILSMWANCLNSSDSLQGQVQINLHVVLGQTAAGWVAVAFASISMHAAASLFEIIIAALTRIVRIFASTFHQ